MGRAQSGGLPDFAPTASTASMYDTKRCSGNFLPLPCLLGASPFLALPLPADPPDLDGAVFPFASSLATAALHSVPITRVAFGRRTGIPIHRVSVGIRVRRFAAELVLNEGAQCRKRIGDGRKPAKQACPKVRSTGCVWIQPRCRLGPCCCAAKLRRHGWSGGIARI